MSSISAIHAMSGVDRFQKLVDTIKDCAIFMLDTEGHVISWNSGAERLVGYSELEILGRHFSCFYTREDIAEGVPEHILNTARQSGHLETEGWRVRKDGSRFRAMVIMDPIFENGTLFGFAKFTRDISLKIKAEQDLLGAREALRNAQRMDVLGRLTSGVAHEFGNLLAVLRSGTERLARADLADQDRSDSQKFLIETIDHATSLTSQLLNFSRGQPLRPEQFDLIDRLLAMRPLLETMLGDSITLKMQLVPELVPVDTDRHQFETAIVNLIVNAREAMIDEIGVKDCVVTLTVGSANEIPEHLASLPPGGSYVTISVSDNGPGINKSILPVIFEPFFTTKRQRSGAGLGLSQVQGFARQSGGDVEVSSAIGKGTTFALHLPRVRRRIVNPIAIDTLPPSYAEDCELSGSVLLVEDNARTADSSLALLEDIGLKTTWARNAEEALTKLQQSEENYDLVLTDVVMPGMSGIALARTIGRRWPQKPVILTSGYSNELAAGHGGELELLQKPYNRKTLLSTLQRHLLAQ